jgi:hypothetical protein
MDEKEKVISFFWVKGESLSCSCLPGKPFGGVVDIWHSYNPESFICAFFNY